MVYSENYDDQGGVTTTFSGLLSNMIGMFEEQVDKVIPEEVANFFGTNNEDESTRKSTDFHRQGKVFRQDKTHNHRGRRMSKSSVKRKVYNVPLNDEVYHNTSGVDTLEESYASPSRYSHSTDTNALTRASIQDLDHGWRAAYSEFRAEQSEGREDIQQKYASGDWETLDEGPEEADLRVPEEPHEVRSLALDEESPRMKALADEDLPQEESEEEVLQYSSPQEASKQGAPMEKQQSTMQSILTSWSSDCCLSRDMLDDEKEKYATARNKSSLMAELKTRIQNFTFERNLNIDQLLSKRKLDEDKDESTVHQGSLAPPPKYSVAHVKEATASPSSQDSFMKEVKKFHKKHILRKVSDEEKGPTKTLLTETTTLLFTPDEVSFTKEESQSNENTGEPGKRALVKKAPEKPKKKLRKHTASKKKTRNAWKKIARIATMFHRKQQVVRDDRGLDLEENEEEEDTSTHDEAHSLASEKKSVRSGKSALSKGSQISKKSSRSQRCKASMNPTPQSLVEQRKSQLEGFFAAYSQKVVRDKPAQDPAAAMPSEVLGQQQLPLTHAATTNSQSTMQSSHGSSSETPKIVNSFSLKSEASGSNPAADPETNCNSTRSSSSSKKENAPQTMRSNIENSMRRSRQFSSLTHLEDEMEEDTFASSIQFTKPKEIAIVKKEMKPPKNELLATISQRSSEKKKKSANQRKRDKRVKQAALFGTSQQVPLSERERQRKERKARLSTTLW